MCKVTLDWSGGGGVRLLVPLRYTFVQRLQCQTPKLCGSGSQIREARGRKPPGSNLVPLKFSELLFIPPPPPFFFLFRACWGLSGSAKDIRN